MNKYPHTLIRASAGTGKTFQLSNRFLGLLEAGVSPDQILATTFTRKAAGEILDRVIVRLAEAALDSNARRELAGNLQLKKLPENECRVLLGSLIQQLHRLQVCTLDSFFAQLAGSFSLELGLPPGWRIIEQLHDTYLRNEAIEATLKSDSNREVQRLVHLMAKGEARRSVSELVRGTVDDLYDLYMETDPQAWKRIPRPNLLQSERLANLIDALHDAPLPSDARFRDALDKNLASAEIGDWEQFIAQGLAGKVLEGQTHYYRKEIPGDVVDLLQQLIGHARAAILDQMANQTEATFELLDKFHGIYGQLKRRTRSLRFEDITRSLARCDLLGTIDSQLFRLDTSIPHLLLDEFQDTSLSQWHVLRPFAKRVTETSEASSFFCVGDVKQAIYGWRGGRSEIFDALERELTELTRDSLNASYRSAQPIIDTVNRVFTNMTNHRNLEKFASAVRAWCDQFEPHTTTKQDLPGYAELCTAPEADQKAFQESATLAFAADRIAQLVRQSPGYSVGVLARRNRVVAQLIYELRARGVPASEEGGNPLTDSPAVQLILSLLKVADHPGDTIARFHLAQSPLASAIQFPDHQDSRRAAALARTIRSDLMHRGYGPTVQQWSQQLASACDRRDRSRLQQFVELAFRYEEIATLRPTDFVRFVEGQRVADPTTAQVRVMTVHQAKGLQFDIVVLPDLDARLVGQADRCVVGQPSPTDPIDRVCLYRNSSIQQLLPDDLQELFEETTRRTVSEALCVLYVALTRAVHALHMVIAPSSDGERQMHKTSAGLLRAALTDGQKLAPQETVFQHGDAQWFASMPARKMTVPDLHQQERDEPILLAPPLAGSRVEHTAPSQLEGGARVPANRVLDLANSVATTRGTMIHALFEQIIWLDDGRPSLEQLRRVAEPLNNAGLNLDQQLAAFQCMLDMPETQSVLSRSFYEPPFDSSLGSVLPRQQSLFPPRVQVHNERRFTVRDDERILSGTIDRLVLLYHDDRLVAADIIDFKTDTIRADDPSFLNEKVEYYRPQIEAYRRAVAKMFLLSETQVAARLLFVSRGVMRIVE